MFFKKGSIKSLEKSMDGNLVIMYNCCWNMHVSTQKYVHIIKTCIDQSHSLSFMKCCFETLITFTLTYIQKTRQYVPSFKCVQINRCKYWKYFLRCHYNYLLLILAAKAKFWVIVMLSFKRTNNGLLKVRGLCTEWPDEIVQKSPKL
jgi:hypothetical protein